MQPLKNVLPPSYGVLHVFCDFETTQNTRYSETAKEHVPNLVCIQRFCSRCEGVEDFERVANVVESANTRSGMIPCDLLTAAN